MSAGSSLLCSVLGFMKCFHIYSLILSSQKSWVMNRAESITPLVTNMNPRVQRGQGPKAKAALSSGLWLGGTMPSLPLERHVTVFRQFAPRWALLISTPYFATLFSRCETIFMLLTFRLCNLVHKNLQPELWYLVFHISASVMCCWAWGL